MLSQHMLNKTSPLKPLFKKILQFCSTVVILQNLSNTNSKLRVGKNLLLKQFLFTIVVFFENSESLITRTGELRH